MSTSVPGVATAQELAFSEWIAGAIVTNPANGAVLVSTGALAAGAYHVAVMCWATAATQVKIVRRNAADSGDVKSIEVPIPANNFIPVTFPTIIQILEGELLKVTLPVAIAGNVQASLLYARVNS